MNFEKSNFGRSGERPGAEELKKRLEQILSKLLASASEGTYAPKGEAGKKAELETRVRLFFENLEPKMEQLDIYEDLALKINELYQQRLLTTPEAEFLMTELRDKSNGRDNYVTLKLLAGLAELDLYNREREAEPEPEKKVISSRYQK